MEEKNQVGDPWSGQNSQGGNPPSVPAGKGQPPNTKQDDSGLSARTMKSDTQSIGESGGGAPTPYTPQPRPEPKPSEQPKKPQGSGSGGSFQPPNITPTPTPPEPPKLGGEKLHSPKKSNKGLFIGIITAIVVIGIAAVVYFFIVPLVMDDGEETPETTPPAQEEPQEEQEENNQDNPEEGIGNLEETDTPEKETVDLSSIYTHEVHASFFENPADISMDVTLLEFTPAEIQGKLVFNPTENPLLREIVLKTSENKPITLQQMGSMTAPDFFTAQFTDYFQEDFTLFTYTNTSGTWMGFVAQLKDDVEAGSVQSQMSSLQSSPNLENFFVEEPGEIGVWEDGSVKEYPTSLVEFSEAGATFSYTWFDRYLVISTNLDGAAQAATYLGY